jgi:hypothetical protein
MDYVFSALFIIGGLIWLFYAGPSLINGFCEVWQDICDSTQEAVDDWCKIFKHVLGKDEDNGCEDM